MMLDVASARVVVIDDNWFSFWLVTVTFDKEQLGLVAVDDSVGHQSDCSWEENLIEKERAFVGLSISRGIFQNCDASHGFVFTFSVNVGHVTPHFNDPHAASAIEGERDGLID